MLKSLIKVNSASYLKIQRLQHSTVKLNSIFFPFFSHFDRQQSQSPQTSELIKTQTHCACNVVVCYFWTDFSSICSEESVQGESLPITLLDPLLPTWLAWNTVITAAKLNWQSERAPSLQLLLSVCLQRVYKKGHFHFPAWRLILTRAEKEERTLCWIFIKLQTFTNWLCSHILCRATFTSSGSLQYGTAALLLMRVYVKGRYQC